jgi:opacity protein-like surface antigen
MALKRKFFPLFWLLVFIVLLAATPSQAEDGDRLRPYFRFHFGNISSLWGVKDMWSFALGANLNRNWGCELEIDTYLKDFNYNGTFFGEASSIPLVPQVRLREPFLNGRLVPYILAGAGVSFLNFHDPRDTTFGHQIDIGGNTFTVTGGAGIEYFVSDNVTLGIEGKYFWLQPVSGTVDGRSVNVNLSAPAFTWGMRAYTDTNRPRPLADEGPESPGRFYFGVRAGDAGFTDDQLVPGVTLSGHSSFNQTAGLLAGWDFNRHWGVELAVDGLWETYFNLAGVGQVGDYGIATIIPQARYRMPLADGRWVPYVTAGVGAAYGVFNAKTAAGRNTDVSANGIYPACSVGAGVDYFITRNISLLANLSWVYSWNHKIQVDNSINGSGDFSTFMLQVGFRVYLFV